jgi:hypothetical protein
MLHELCGGWVWLKIALCPHTQVVPPYADCLKKDDTGLAMKMSTTNSQSSQCFRIRTLDVEKNV